MGANPSWLAAWHSVHTSPQHRQARHLREARGAFRRAMLVRIHMRSSKQTIVGALVASALALVSAYALAQAKPTTPPKGPQPATADACPCAKAGQCAAGCSCGPCAAAKAGDAGLACPAGACKHGAMACPMGELASLADVKLENTKSGATIQFVAKDTKKLAEVQTLAAKVVEKIKAGGCPMMEGGANHPHGGHHGPMMGTGK